MNVLPKNECFLVGVVETVHPETRLVGKMFFDRQGPPMDFEARAAYKGRKMALELMTPTTP